MALIDLISHPLIRRLRHSSSDLPKRRCGTEWYLRLASRSRFSAFNASSSFVNTIKATLLTESYLPAFVSFQNRIFRDSDFQNLWPSCWSSTRYNCFASWCSWSVFKSLESAHQSSNSIITVEVFPNCRIAYPQVLWPINRGFKRGYQLWILSAEFHHLNVYRLIASGNFGHSICPNY